MSGSMGKSRGMRMVVGALPPPGITRGLLGALLELTAPAGFQGGEHLTQNGLVNGIGIGPAAVRPCIDAAVGQRGVATAIARSAVGAAVTGSGVDRRVGTAASAVAACDRGDRQDEFTPRPSAGSEDPSA